MSEVTEFDWEAEQALTFEQRKRRALLKIAEEEQQELTKIDHLVKIFTEISYEDLSWLSAQYEKRCSNRLTKEKQHSKAGKRKKIKQQIKNIKSDRDFISSDLSEYGMNKFDFTKEEAFYVEKFCEEKTLEDMAKHIGHPKRAVRLYVAFLKRFKGYQRYSPIRKVLDRKKIVELYEKGLSIRAIGEKLNCLNNIYYYLNDNPDVLKGVERKDLLEIDVLQVIELYKSGKSISFIANQFNINRKKLTDILIKENVHVSKSRNFVPYNILETSVNLYKAGMTVSSIANDLGVDRSTISRYLNKKDVTVSRGKVKDEHVDEWIRQYNSGKTFKEISNSFVPKTTPNTISVHLKKRGVTVRDTKFKKNSKASI